jgi:two-component system, LytTR family, sensor kinase
LLPRNPGTQVPGQAGKIYKINFNVKNLQHILFLYWILYYALISFIEAGPQQYYSEAFLSNLIALPVKFIFVLITIGPLTDHLLLKKRVAAFFLLYFLLLIIFAALLRVVDNYLILPYILTHWIKQPVLDAPAFLYSAIKLQFVAAIPFMIKIFSHWAEIERRHARHAQQQTEAELAFLRNQFHPHFLFNALNSLYSKIITNPPQASDIVLRICSLLRFSLYEASRSPIALSREIEYLTNYMELQKIRFGDRISISFSVFGESAAVVVEPFLILPFIENSFKFCQTNKDGEAWVTVQISVEGNFLVAQIDNSLGGTISVNDDSSHGLGQVNVKKRLGMLYPGNHQLRCERGDENYYVYLKFPLAFNGSELHYN